MRSRDFPFPIFRWWIGLALAVGLTGCATTPFKVTAMRFDEAEPRQRTFVVAHPPRDGATDAEIASRLEGFVEKALVTRGFRAAPSGLPADMIIEVTYEEEPPRMETRTRTENIYMWQPERTVLTTKKKKLPSGVSINEVTTTRKAAGSEVVGKRSTNYTLKVFPKHLRIVGRSVVDATKMEIGRPLWTVDVHNEEEIEDRDRFLVLMVASAMDYLGDDFSGEKTVYISWQDKQTRLLLASVKG